MVLFVSLFVLCGARLQACRIDIRVDDRERPITKGPRHNLKNELVMSEALRKGASRRP
jgi:hypothetical protein